MASGRRVAFVPPAGAVQEFKVETASFDAASGHTAGATVNVTLKSGTNALKGSGYTYYRSDKLAEKDFFVKKANAAKPGLSYNRPGLHLRRTGPARQVVLLHRRRVALRRVPRAAVPDGADAGDAQRRLLGAAGAGHRHLRSAERRDLERHRGRPPAVRRQHHSAEPHQPDRAERAQLLSAAEPAGGRERPQQLLLRQSAHRRLLFVVDPLRSHGDREAAADGALHAERSARGAQRANSGRWTASCRRGNFLFRKNDGVTLNHTWTQSNSSLWEIRGGWQQFREPNVRQHEGDLRSGVARVLVERRRASSAAREYFPLFDFDTLTRHRRQPGRQHDAPIYSFQPTYTKLSGSHSIRAGYDLRQVLGVQREPGRQAGEYLSRNNGGAFTRADQHRGGAEFPGRRDVPHRVPDRRQHRPERAAHLNNTWYHGVLRAGRLEALEQADAEPRACATTTKGPRPKQQNGNVRGFDPAAMLSITTAAEAAYAARPDIVPASQWRARGGVEVRVRQHARLLERRQEQHPAAPRVRLHAERQDRAPRRHGASTPSPFVFSNGVNQMGYSQVTPYTASPEQRSDVPVHAEQPVSERRAAAGRQLARARTPSSARASNRFMPIDGVQSTQLLALHRQPADAAPGALAPRGRLRRQPRLQHHHGRRAERDPGAVPVHAAESRDQATIDFLARQRAESVRRRSAADRIHRRQRRALAAAAAVPAVQQRADQRLRRHAASTTRSRSRSRSGSAAATRSWAPTPGRTSRRRCSG